MEVEAQPRVEEDVQLPTKYISCTAVDKNSDVVHGITVNFAIQNYKSEDIKNDFNQDSELNIMSDNITMPIMAANHVLEVIDELIQCVVCYGYNKPHEQALVCYNCDQFICNSCRTTIMETAPLHYTCPMCKSTSEKWKRNKTIEQLTIKFFRKAKASCNVCHLVEGQHDAVAYHASLCTNRR